jgi:hypothetical protein
MIEVEKVSRWVSKARGSGGRSAVMHEARLGDLTVTAKTAAEAKTALVEAAAKILTGTYTPLLIRHGNWLAIIAREYLGESAYWGYRLVDLDELGERTVVHLSTRGAGSREDLERSARAHIAQNLFSHDDPLAGLALLHDDEDRRQYLSDASWQRRYKALADAGYEGRIHETASRMDPWPEHIERPADLTDPQRSEVSTS